MRNYYTITTDVSVDVNDILDEMTDDEIREMCLSRGIRNPVNDRGIVDWLETTTGRKLYSMTNDEICNHVLKEIGRYVI